MATQRRKIEVHRLTISGLPEGTPYGPFLHGLRGHNRPVAEMVLRANQKSHAANDVTLRNNMLRLRFLSFTQGHRPDVLDTNVYSIQPNPLKPSQTNVEWTHVLGAFTHGRYALLVERNPSGIWPSTLGRYLQWMVDQFFEPGETKPWSVQPSPLTVSLEAEPGPEFLARLDQLDDVSEATVRIVRPNPGWSDLEAELGDSAEQSDARRVDLTFAARRKGSLSWDTGIVAWIRKAFADRRLGFASIRGRKALQKDFFTTEKLGKHSLVDLELDERGQVLPDDAWHKLSLILRELD